MSPADAGKRRKLGKSPTVKMIKKHAIMAKISDDIENAKRNKKEVLEHNSLKVRTIV